MLKTTTRFIKSMTASFLVVLFCGGLLLSPVYVKAQEDDGERKLRAGHCWLDGKPNCRKKKKGDTCDERKHCSAEAYATVGYYLIAGAAVIVK